MRIEVSQLPPEESSPNWRGHWTKKWSAERVYHNAVFYACIDARNRAYSKSTIESLLLPFAKARLNLTFVFPQQRRRDKDNLLARFKPGLDGIVASGLVVDDDAEHLEISGVDILVDPKRAPLTVIDIENLAG